MNTLDLQINLIVEFGVLTYSFANATSSSDGSGSSEVRDFVIRGRLVSKFEDRLWRVDRLRFEFVE